MLHGGKFIYIRFNPDKFKDKNDKSINPMLYTRLPILHLFSFQTPIFTT